MALIANERDKTLQTAAVRTVEVVPPAAVIIPGYTGVVITPDYRVLASAFGQGPYAVNQDVELRASLRGIPPGTSVTWDTGQIERWPTGHAETTGKEVVPPDSPGLGSIGASGPGYTLYWFPGVGNLILTDTGDPLVKLVRKESYPVPPGQFTTSGPSGTARVRLSYGGQTFMAFSRIVTFYG